MSKVGRSKRIRVRSEIDCDKSMDTKLVLFMDIGEAGGTGVGIDGGNTHGHGE